MWYVSASKGASSSARSAGMKTSLSKPEASGPKSKGRAPSPQSASTARRSSRNPAVVSDAFSFAAIPAVASTSLPSSKA